jgi:hypothetical protein
MNSNLFHNIANILMIVLSMATAGLLATGCTTTAAGVIECSQSFISPTWSVLIVGALGVLKVLVNVARDGLTGLTKPQPPVEK